MTPMVSMAMLKNCVLVYRFPQIQPTSIVVTLPPLRRMICTGTEMLYPKAKLLSMFTEKNSTMFGNHRMRGTARNLRKNGGCEAEK